MRHKEERAKRIERRLKLVIVNLILAFCLVWSALTGVLATYGLYTLNSDRLLNFVLLGTIISVYIFSVNLARLDDDICMDEFIHSKNLTDQYKKYEKRWWNGEV